MRDVGQSVDASAGNSGDLIVTVRRKAFRLFIAGLIGVAIALAWYFLFLICFCRGHTFPLWARLAIYAVLSIALAFVPRAVRTMIGKAEDS